MVTLKTAKARAIHGITNIHVKRKLMLELYNVVSIECMIDMLDHADPNGHIWRGKHETMFNQNDFKHRLKRVAMQQAQQLDGEFGLYWEYKSPHRALLEWSV